MSYVPLSDGKTSPNVESIELEIKDSVPPAYHHADLWGKRQATFASSDRKNHLQRVESRS